MKIESRLIISMIILFIVVLQYEVGAQIPSLNPEKKEAKAKEQLSEEKEKDKDKDKDKDAIKSISEVVKKAKEYKGLFTTYQDTTNGQVYLEIDQSQLDKDYIHFAQVLDGVNAGARLIRGIYMSGKIFTIHRIFDKIEVRLKNTSYYFDPENALSRSADANINSPIIYSEKIIAQNKDRTRILIDGDKLFLNESFAQIKPSANPSEKPGSSFKLGSLSKEKSKFISIRNYPENSDYEVELVYEDSYPVRGGQGSLTDPRFVSYKLINSLIAVPDNDYRPRRDDARVGYFHREVNDMTSTAAAPYRDLIHRWHLKKKDPSAAMSEPVEPIVWWIENTTPLEFRDYIREGVLQWNKAFEKAGFKNAIVVKQQPDDADWDAGDIRYNVLRWTSSPNPVFGGYGPSFVNPLTGQILGADVMLEYIFITNRLRQEAIFETAGIEHLEDIVHDTYGCTLAHHMQQSMMFGQQVLEATNGDKSESDKLIQQALYMLTLHEVGHTLGLNHNMKASNLHDPISIHDEKLTRDQGLTGSVMDYSGINIAPNAEDQGLYFDVVPGPYDVWAIQYGYSEFDPGEEEQQLNALLSRSGEHALMFGNDADDMRSAGRGIDPRVMIGDMSSDPIAYSEGRMQLVQSILPKLEEKFAKPGESYQELRNAYLTLTSEVGTAIRVASRYIGGVYVDRSVVGQSDGAYPFTPVPKEQQQRAMSFLHQYAFSPDAFQVPESLYRKLQSQRRGFHFFGANEDPKIHDRILSFQKDVLDHLLHENTFQRILDSELYGNEYKLSEFLPDLTDAIFQDDLNAGVSTMRQNLQIEYCQRLLSIVDDSSSFAHASKALVYDEIQSIKKQLSSATQTDQATKAHRSYITYLIDHQLNKK